MTRRLFSAIFAAALIATLTASAAFAGEITGNGKSLHVTDGGKWGTGLHSRSSCAFSGQEDLQFESGGSKGVPGHAQNWGHIADRQSLPDIFHPGISCNPTRAVPLPL